MADWWGVGEGGDVAVTARGWERERKEAKGDESEGV